MADAAAASNGARPVTITAGTLARRIGVPASILSFLEEQFPEIRAIKSSGGRVYRAVDAALLAGLVDALYREGLPFREVQEAARSAGRAAIVERGRALIGVDLRAVAPARPVAEIPPDALVHRKGPKAAPASPPAAGGQTSGEAILRELMACVRILGAARRHEPT